MRLLCSSYLVLGLVKLRLYGAAEDELLRLGDLDGPQYRDAQGGSLVPWALRMLGAELPAKLDRRTEALDRMHALLRRTDAAVAAAEQAADAEAGKMWERRRGAVRAALVAQHLGARQHGAALSVLDRALKERPTCPRLWSQVGYVQLGLGDIKAAAATFAKVEGFTPDADTHVLVPRNRVLLLFAQNKYSECLDECDISLAVDPKDAVATNNRALVLLYRTGMAQAAEMLELALHRDASAFLQDYLLINLCSMYDLRAGNLSTVSKRQLYAWASRCCADDLDLSPCSKG